ncbi:class II aldolase/adducin family protein [Petrotoga sp. 9PWA.NaAc.5.4]|uniref:class II aldolase/adducin family protein n=1 Tax=Petrotoga sp. 9PWA.NaAc.5.4 TaxID=1434328 RepID=UPI000CCA45B0|nr:class II aldolase/adducin family protein [Petrotoga sp. 9PWA.NaAc.5.4]PNR95790.1 aldolase [Petrotoga sp. 9PWA.NaAc.5.4]
MQSNLLKNEVAEFAKLVWDRKLTDGTGGNMSIKDGEKIYITPTSTIKHFLTEKDIITIDKDGNKIEGEKDPSSERRMHLKIYEKASDVTAVIHAHPIFSTSFAITFEKLPINALPESALVLDPITYIEYKMPGTQEFADAFEEGLERGSKVFVLQNHGVTVAGKDMKDAYVKLETLEFLAQVSFISKLYGNLTEIPVDKIKAFKEFVNKK